MKFLIIRSFYANDFFLKNKTAKYIDIESNTREKLDDFLIEQRVLPKKRLNLTIRNIQNLSEWVDAP